MYTHYKQIKKNWILLLYIKKYKNKEIKQYKKNGGNEEEKSTLKNHSGT